MTSSLARRTSLALICAFLVACGRGAPPAPENLPPPMSGTVDGQTQAFTLSGGDYRVDWSVTHNIDSQVGCVFGLWLQEAGGSGFEDVLSTEVEVGQTERGTANLHDVAAGRWYFEVIGRCPWTLAIRR